MEEIRERFNVRRDLSGRVRIECPPIMLVPPDIAVQMAKAIMEIAGVHVVFSDPGQTVLRPPSSPAFPIDPYNRRNGNGGK